MVKWYKKGHRGGRNSGVATLSRQNYDTGVKRQAMLDAIELVEQHGYRIQDAAAEKKVGYLALWRRLNNPDLNPHVGFQQKLPRSALDSFAATAQILAEMGYPLNTHDFREIVFEFCREAASDDVRDAFKGKMPSKEWIAKFLRDRPELTLRSAEQTTVARASAFNRQTVDAWFRLLGRIFIKHPILMREPERIFNADESSFCTDPKGKGKFVAPRGIRNVSAVIEGTGRKNHTVLACASASGLVLPPYILYNGVKPQAAWQRYLGDLAGMQVNCTASGWMTGASFLHWFENGFLPYVPNKRPLLLL